ncbi:MAG: hypothetical protein Tsb002_11740 [Wenzhouxiangellaceae bacterium]
MKREFLYRLACLLVFVFCCSATSAMTTINPGGDPLPVPQPRFDTWRTQPGTFKQPDYPIVFVASYRKSSGNGGNMGTDVTQVGVPEGGQELWVVLPNGAAKKLFPIQGVHDADVDESLALVNGRILGAVSEPSISIDGERVYFSYFHNATDLPPGCCGSTGHSNFEGWPKGGDLYVIDLAPLIADNQYPVAQLSLSRLTQTAAGAQYDHAMNPSAATITGPFPAGVVYTGALEIDTASGRKLLFTSTRRQLGNSNDRMTRKNKNYNLFVADIGQSEGVYSLANIRQEQYYTTTSVISPNRQRTGYAISYQANTEDNRQWHIQQIVGHVWKPLYGYGIGNEAAHLSTFCVKNTAGALPTGDYTVVTRYYNLNNNGFGALFAQDMTDAGLNNYNAGVTYGKVPVQIGATKITSGVITSDNPSSNGKFTTPACGGPDELFAAYDPGIANHKNQPYSYFPEIVFTDLEPADPAVTPAAYQPVVRATSSEWAALWPKPVIDWSYRLTGTPDAGGNAQQQTAATAIDPNFPEPPGSPYGQFGTSSLYNTDVTPVDCRIYNGYYDPNVVGDAKVDNMYNNIANLSRVMVDAPGNIVNQTGSCSMPLPADVYGIAIYLTSNRINEKNFDSFNRGYTTDNISAKESKRLLGVFEVGMNGQLDTSFKAIVPANAPVDFHLLDQNGAKLADVRSWHSLKPRETRVDCGGCHNHRPNQDILWSNSDSSSPLIPALDMVRQTTYLDFDASCQPTLTTSTDAARDVSNWQDIAPGFDANCGSCHEQNSGNTTALNALSYDATQLTSFTSTAAPTNGNPLKSLFARNYIDKYGANGSPMFWAAMGQRTDGRDNQKPEYQPDQPDFSTCSNTDPAKCGYYYGSVHDNLPLCDGSNPTQAQWVYQLSQWIDNHAPADIPGEPFQYHHDRYHPSVDGALVTAHDCLTPSSFDVGFWDDSGSLVELDIDLNGADWINVTNPAQLNNGFYSVPLSGGSIVSMLRSTIRVTAIDAADNRQSYEKTVLELVQECQQTSL